MYGHAGADIFWFDDGQMTAPGVSLDRIHDFNAAEGDVIDLSAIDADTTIDGDQAFIHVAEFTGEAGEYFLQAYSGYVIVQFDTNGDGGADLVLRIDGTTDGVTGWVL